MSPELNHESDIDRLVEAALHPTKSDESELPTPEAWVWVGEVEGEDGEQKPSA